MTTDERRLLLLLADAVLHPASMRYAIQHTAIRAAYDAVGRSQQLTTPTEAERRAQGDAWLAQQRRDFSAGGIDAA